jgi:hypothetical protein
MTVFQQKQAVVKALRNVRKQHRSLQTKGEELERVLDRLIARKTLITPGQLAQAQQPYQALKAKFVSIEQALKDAVTAAQL